MHRHRQLQIRHTAPASHLPIADKPALTADRFIRNVKQELPPGKLPAPLNQLFLVPGLIVFFCHFVFHLAIYVG